MHYGLIAGNGQFPFRVLEGAQRAGASLAVVAIREETDPDIERAAAAAGGSVTWVGLGQLGKMIRFFKNAGVAQAIMAGQVKHTQIFSGAVPDARMLKMILKLQRRNTTSLIGAVADELLTEGITLIDSTHFLQDELPQPGTLTKREPNDRERGDIDYGLEIARSIAELDLGQTLVVRARACVAIEAMEGTDATIRRAGEVFRKTSKETGAEGSAEGKSVAGSAGKLLLQGLNKIRGGGVLSGFGLTVLKIAKPNQDMRFDVPVIGVPTIENMIEAGAGCLCISAGKTLMFDREEMLALANENQIAIVAVGAKSEELRAKS
jgi:UDP-2,3-diacylglucosamine hydrolase